MSKTLFISDLHLEPASPAITQCFLRFLHSLNHEVDALYILGDLFEAWIGDDDTSEFHQQIIDALRQVTQQKKIPVYFMHGNRDFLIGKKFLATSGCVLLQDETVISLYRNNVLLMHGDTLCTLDKEYIKSRKILRNSVVQKLFLLLPLSLRQRIANGMRKASQQHTSETAPDYMDATSSAVENVMQKHAVTQLIHGHTHKPAIHTFSLMNQPAKRIVLGAWHQKGSVLTYSNTGDPLLSEIS